MFFFSLVLEQPDTKMIREPIWSTWAKYQNDINDNLVYDLAESVHNNEFRGQIQIDDGWEVVFTSLSSCSLLFFLFLNILLLS